MNVFQIEKADNRKRSEMQGGIMSKDCVKIWANVNIITSKVIMMFL